jgi:hypothetical protein
MLYVGYGLVWNLADVALAAGAAGDLAAAASVALAYGKLMTMAGGGADRSFPRHSSPQPEGAALRIRISTGSKSQPQRVGGVALWNGPW